ncbi:MAG: twin-arginine translocase subunit TatC [Halovenus sp.]
MSGALDSDAARTLASGRATIGSMLSAAQAHLKKVFLVFVVGMIGTIWALRSFIWDRLKTDLVYNQMDQATTEATEIIAVTPFDVILLQVKIGLVVGIFVAIPVLLYYSRDALKARGTWPSGPIPRWKIWGFVVAILFLFVAGVAYAYFLFFPIMFDFLAANALQAGFDPTWSIVMWTEFVFFLSLSFGVAAQLPLAMSSAARSGVVRYETFRDKWRYAVVGIFVFGAVFSPPDPFTQVMWGVPLVLLYGVSLGITRFAVLSKRASQSVSTRDVVRENWNLLAGGAVLAAAAMFVYLQEGGLEAANDLLARIGSDVRFPAAGDIGVFGLPPETVAIIASVLAGLLAAGTSLFYLRIVELEQVTQERALSTAEPDEADDDEEAEPGEPAEIDIGAMSARAIEATPAEAFTELSEERALEYAQAAVDEENPEKAQAILDSLDEAQELEAKREEEREDDEDEPDDPITSTAAGMVDSFTEEETTEDDIGGYYYDLRFILDSLTSKTIWIVATFMIVLAGTFMFLYLGGIGVIVDFFLQNMPAGMSEQVDIVTLHPVEALIFMIKFSTLLAFLAIVPLLLYFAWPAVEDRGLSTGNRSVLLVWGGTMVVALAAGTAIGFLFIAPAVLSVLATDVITSEMIIAYRISNFGWLVIYLTVGVGVMAMIPATMLLFHHGNIVPYSRMRKSWRGVVLAFFAAAGLLSPKGVFTMFLVAIPASLAYIFGLGCLRVYAFVSPRETAPAGDVAD